jgi:predicted AAA+ superfamily ATPase
MGAQERGLDYHRRIIDADLDELLDALPAISLEGAKGVGKTATARQRAATVFDLDRPEQRAIVAADPFRVVQATPPVLIDEWQRVPATWDAVRRAVDDAPATPGRFLLTGSASPSTPPTHSGAGRIVRLRMWPMTLPERGVSIPTVSFQRLLSGERPSITGETDVTLDAYVVAICASGLPGVRHLTGRALRAQLEGYVERIVDTDLREVGLEVRRPGTLRSWMTAYAAAISGTASYETIRDGATSGQAGKPAKTTTIPYREALQRLWVVEPVPAWLPTRNHLSELTVSPKHQLADPALATALLGMDATALLDPGAEELPVPRDGTYLGALFESLATLTLRVLAQRADAQVRHLRTKGGRQEVDLIIERRDGRIIACEVKLSATVDDDDVRHLHWLGDRIGADLIERIVLTTGPGAYRRPDGVAVVPLALLGA